MRLADIDRDTVWSLERHAGGEPEERLQRTDMVVAMALDMKRVSSLHESDVIDSLPEWQQIAWAAGVSDDCRLDQL